VKNTVLLKSYINFIYKASIVRFPDSTYKNKQEKRGQFCFVKKTKNHPNIFFICISGGISVRTLQTIESMNTKASNTVVFALPSEIMEGFKKLVRSR